MPKFSFCPKCAGPLEYKIVEEDALNREPVCTKCGFVFWQNSKPTVSGILRDDEGRLLLIERAIEPKRGEWNLPGGFTGYGEDPKDALVREMQEELSVLVEPLELIGVFLDTYGPDKDSTFNLIYTAKILSGEIKPASDVASTRWFSFDELPESMAFRCDEETFNLLLEREGLAKKYRIK